MKVGARHQRLIREAMSGLSGQAARAVADDLALRFGVSRATVYRLSADVRPGRKLRSDREKPRHGVSEAALETADGLIFNMQYTAERAVEILEANGLVEPGQISGATLRREIARRSGLGCRALKKMTPKKIKPLRSYQNTHRRMEADYPNQVVAVDFTVAGQFYVDAEQNLGYLSPLVHRKNRENMKGSRLWIYCAIDLYSRARFTMAYPGMTSTYWLDFLYNWVSWKSDFPFYGLPEHIRADGDARIKEKTSQRVLDALGVQLQIGVANPNFNGMVERQFYSLKDVQNATRLHKLMLDGFNLMLRAEDFRYNTRKHTTTGEVPFQRFMRMVEKVRVIPDRELFDTLMFDELYLRVDPYLCYRVRGETYQLPDVPPFNEMARKKVVMRWGRRSADRIVVLWKGREYDAPVMPQVIVPAVGDHPHVPKKNLQEKYMETAMEQDLSGLDTWNYLLERNAKVGVLWKPGETPVEIRHEEPLKNMTEAIEKVRQAVAGPFGALTPAQGLFLRETFKDGATASMIEEAITALKEDVKEETA